MSSNATAKQRCHYDSQSVDTYGRLSVKLYVQALLICGRVHECVLGGS